jgi:hypothetical protein
MTVPPQLTPAAPAPAVKAPADIKPVGIQIPSIGVKDGEFTEVGLDSHHELQVPPLSEPMEVAWYKHSPPPGDVATCSYAAGCVGSTVLLAHINGDGQEGAFARLAQVKTGNEVDVVRSDGQTAVFKVYKVMIFNKSAFPTEAVYGDTQNPELRLITCGPGELRHGNYLEQTVVLAKFIDMKPSS